MLGGVTDELAKTIIDYRNANGPFGSVQDFGQILEVDDTTYRSATGLSKDVTLQDAELRLNEVLDIDADGISMNQIASASIKSLNLVAMFISGTDGLVLAEAIGDESISGLKESLAAVAPQLYKKSQRSLTQAQLPVPMRFSVSVFTRTNSRTPRIWRSAGPSSTNWFGTAVCEPWSEPPAVQGAEPSGLVYRTYSHFQSRCVRHIPPPLVCERRDVSVAVGPPVSGGRSCRCGTLLDRITRIRHVIGGDNVKLFLRGPLAEFMRPFRVVPVRFRSRDVDDVVVINSATAVRLFLLL